MLDRMSPSAPRKSLKPTTTSDPEAAIVVSLWMSGIAMVPFCAFVCARRRAPGIAVRDGVGPSRGKRASVVATLDARAGLAALAVESGRAMSALRPRAVPAALPNRLPLLMASSSALILSTASARSLAPTAWLRLESERLQARFPPDRKTLPARPRR